MTMPNRFFLSRSFMFANAPCLLFSSHNTIGMDGLAHRPFHFLQLSAYAVGFQNLFCFRNGVCQPIVIVFTGQDAHNCLGVDLIAVKNTIPCFKMFERIDERSTDTVIINCLL